jgi:quercetin dioxygenase-like cupin family protein
MYLTKEDDHEYRFKDHGPKYLTRGENVDLGIVVITPGEAHPCHKHTKQEESFLALEGVCDVWVDGKRIVLSKGDYLICEQGEAHFFNNTYDEDFKAVFIKAPHLDEKDSVYIEWKPGQTFVKEV